MTAVTNAGPLIALAKVGALGLLSAVFDPCLMPTAVYEEVVVSGLSSARPDALVVREAVGAHRVRVVDIQEADIPLALSSLPVDRGERQAIHACLKLATDYVLLDDAAAREHARALGVSVKGTMGVIVQATRIGALPPEQASALVLQIQARSDIWISGDLCNAVLESLNSP